MTLSTQSDRPPHEVRVRRIDPPLCTCGAHYGDACQADSSRCDGGRAYIGEDGSLWLRSSGALTIDTQDTYRRYAGWIA